mgnify:CR=1 FL=1|tara:strand:- start:1184 stop:1978 length:795 start_codon:yes stop_codon:yes gene_type:complete
MDIATIFGLITGTGLILAAMVLEAAGGQVPLTKFWNPSSMMIVLGGTLAATAVGFRLKEVVRVFSLIKFVLQKPKYILSDLVSELITASEVNKKGPNELEQHISNVKTPFIQDGIEFISQGIKFEDLEAILNQREQSRYKRETHESELMKTLGTFSPAFGMVGTLIGLVFMLFNMGGSGGIDSIGPAMGVALITTFYGAVLANLIFNPFAEKLQARNKENSHAHQLMIHGLLLIWKKKHPLEVKDMLISYIPHEERKQFLDSNE